MDVFMTNLPPDLTERALTVELKPHMHALEIGDLHWMSEKPKRRTFGNITFLRAHDGDRFLKRYGESTFPPRMSGNRGASRRRSNLYMLGMPIFCKLNKSQDGRGAGIPNPLTIRALEHAITEKESRRNEENDPEAPVVFGISSMSCGYTAFHNSRLVYVPEVEWANNLGPRPMCKFTRRNMIVHVGKWTVRIPIKSVVELDWDKNGTLTLTLSSVPLFFEEDGFDVRPMLNALGFQEAAQEAGNPPEKSRLCALGDTHANIVGQCLVYQFKTSPSDLEKKIKHLAKQHTLTVVPYHHVTATTALPGLGDFTSMMRALKNQLTIYCTDDSLPFAIAFQLQALAYNGYLHPGTVLALTNAVHQTVQVDKAAGRKPSISVDAVKKLFEQIDWPRPNGNPSAFEARSIMELLNENEALVHDGSLLRTGLFSPTDSLARIHRVTVTPTRIRLYGPEMESRNRILRQFPKHHDCFVRVQFCDEDGQDFQFSTRTRNDDIISRFRSVLEKGIQIAGRTYKFLGFSHSSLRAHSLWLYTPFTDDEGRLQTYYTIITALGNFNDIFSPARCAARIGQAFSETPFALSLDEHEVLVTVIPDVKSPDGSRVFSDGVGTMSMEVAQEIWNVLPMGKSSPTCFQIRVGGAKGMLAVDARLEGLRIQIRPSMIKFDSQDMRVLGICDMAKKPIRLVLNRQLVKILEDMGVKQDWFFDLQEAEVARLRAVTSSAENTADFLKSKSIGDSIALQDFIKVCGIQGLDYRDDDFLRSVVESSVLRELRLLKHKARIPVKEGITLFGIMDETGLLDEEQVFVVYDTMQGRYPDPPEHMAKLLVTRSPALHPGDVQRAVNIVPPDDHPLWEVSNCIVFSQKGTRDLPSELSGGDLDGDLYNVIWDPKARPKWIFHPADYARVQPRNIGRNVTVDDMADFFIDFMKTDILGVIAMRHMILADQLPRGTLDPVCLKLAQMHSTAVDFSKTGIPAALNELPRASKYRPDFLAPGPECHIVDKSQIELEDLILPAIELEDEDDGAGPRYVYYRSDKILGLLYRAIDERRIWEEDVKSTARTSIWAPSFWMLFLDFAESKCRKLGNASWMEYSGKARRLKYVYDDAIMAAMNDFSDDPMHPITELEVFIGNILNKTGVQTHRQRDRSHKLRMPSTGSRLG